MHGFVIYNTFPGFGSMTVRNKNMMTMPSFVVIINCIFQEKRPGKTGTKIIYVIMKKLLFKGVIECDDHNIVWHLLSVSSLRNNGISYQTMYISNRGNCSPIRTQLKCSSIIEDCLLSFMILYRLSAYRDHHGGPQCSNYITLACCINIPA